MRTKVVMMCVGVLVTIAGCASPQPGPGGPLTPSPSPPAATVDKLTVSVQNASTATTTWTLTCSPIGGTHPDPERACSALDSGAQSLPAVPKDRQCAQVFSGPETAVVSGVWKGQQLLSRFSRVNSCETARWKALEGLLPSTGS